MTRPLALIAVLVALTGCASIDQKLGRLDQAYAEVARDIDTAAKSDLITDVPTLKKLRTGLAEAGKLRNAAHVVRTEMAIGDAATKTATLSGDLAKAKGE